MAFNPGIAAEIAAQAAKRVALKTGNSPDIQQPVPTTTASIKPPPVPKRASAAQAEDTAAFSKGQPKAETTAQTPHQGDTVTVKSERKLPPPPPKRTTQTPATLDSPPPVPPRKQTISPPKEEAKATQQPLKGDAAERAFLEKWEADPNNKGKALPAALKDVANRRRIEQLDKAIAETDELIAQAQQDNHTNLEKLNTKIKQGLVNEKIALQIKAADVSASSGAATNAKQSIVGSLLAKTGLRKSSVEVKDTDLDLL